MTINSAFQILLDSIGSLYERDEVEAIARIVFEDVFGLLPSNIVIDGDKEFSAENANNLFKIIERLKSWEPVQYVTGKSYFFSNVFHVNSSVLIPRPETEELVQWVLQVTVNKQQSILDIGTGSGCIAISLKENLPLAELYATDISNDALKVAEINSEKLNKKIQFANSDILKLDNPFNIKFDIIISNPPYIAESEKSSLDNNIIDFEPHTALFAKGDDALIFYKKIIQFCNQYLNESGRLFFEINQQYGDEVKKLLTDNYFSQVELKKDINGNNRMIKAMR